MKHNKMIRKVLSLTLVLAVLISVFGANAFVLRANPDFVRPGDIVKPNFNYKKLEVKFDPHVQSMFAMMFSELNPEKKLQKFSSKLGVTPQLILEPNPLRMEGKKLPRWEYNNKEIAFGKAVIYDNPTKKWIIPTVDGENIKLNGTEENIQIIIKPVWEPTETLTLRFDTKTQQRLKPKVLFSGEKCEENGSGLVNGNKVFKAWMIKEPGFEGLMLDLDKVMTNELDDDDEVFWHIPVIDADGNKKTKTTTRKNSNIRTLQLEAKYEEPADNNDPADDNNGEPADDNNNEPADDNNNEPADDNNNNEPANNDNNNEPTDNNNSDNSTSPTKRDDIKITAENYDKAIVKYTKPFIKGYKDGTFRPKKTINRAEMATVFARVLGIQDKPLEGTASFSDIEGHWAEENILRLAEYGLLKGYPDGTFKPKKPMNKAEITSMITKLWKERGFTPDSTDAGISDVENHWSKKYVTPLYNHGFVNLTDNKFMPKEPLTREEVAQILNRLTDRPLQLLPEQFSDVKDDNPFYNEINTAANPAE